MFIRSGSIHRTFLILIIFFISVAFALEAQAQGYGYRRSITVDRTKVRNPATLPIAFDNVTSAKTADAGELSKSWNHTVGSGNDKIAIVSVSSKRDASVGITLDSTASATTGTGSASSLNFSHSVGSGSNRVAVVSVATGPGVLSIGTDAPSSSGNNGSGATTVSWTHTTGSGNNRILIVGVSLYRTTGTETVTLVTYNTIYPLTLIGSQNTGTTAGHVRMEMYYLLNPPSGSYTVTVNLSGTTPAVGGAASFSNIDQVAPSGFNSNSGTSLAPTVTVTSAPGEVVIDTLVQRNTTPSTGNPTVGAGQTQQWVNVTSHPTANNNVYGGGSTEPGAASVTMSWTIGGSTSVRWAIGAVRLRPATTTVPTVSSVTYAGTDITANLIGTALNSGNCRVSMYYIKNPANASNTVVVTLSGSARFTVAATSFFNVDQTTSFGTFNSATGNSTSATVTVTSATGDVVLDVVAHRDSTYTITANASQTQRWTQLAQDSGNAVNSARGAGSTKPGATSTTMTWTITGTAQWAIGAVPLKPASPPVTITQVMFGATNITANLIGTALNATNSEVSMYYMLNPTSGSNTVSITQSASTRFVAGVFSFFNVSQTTPFGTFASDTRSGNGGDFLIFNTSSANGEIVVATLAKTYNDAIAQRASNQQAGRWNLWTSDATPANNILSIGSLRGGATSAPFHWDLTGTSGQQLAFGAVPIKPTTAAPPQLIRKLVYYTQTEILVQSHP